VDIISPNAVDDFLSNSFVIVNVSHVLIAKVGGAFDKASAFFQQSLETKMACSLAQDMGYRPYGVEYSQSPSFPDQIESFSISMRAPIDSSQLNTPKGVALNQQMIALFSEFEGLAESFALKLAARFSDTPRHELTGTLRNWSRLQINYCQPKTLSSPLINETHEDGNFLTVTCATGPGLQLKVRNEFIPITTAEDQILIIAGEIASLLSGGQISPTFHRVVTHSELDKRLALIFFADIDPASCLPWVVNQNNRNIDIGKRVWDSVDRFGLNGFFKE
jgi:isopenicillin N synthase-like dioxygenase